MKRGQWDSDSKVHGDNMGFTWGRQDPVGPQVGPMNFAIRECIMIYQQGILCCTAKTHFYALVNLEAYFSQTTHYHFYDNREI